jgi:DNA mismatch repair ATPase MutL
MAVLLPQVHFRLLVDGKQKLNYPAAEDQRGDDSPCSAAAFERQDFVSCGRHRPRHSGCTVTSRVWRRRSRASATTTTLRERAVHSRRIVNHSIKNCLTTLCKKDAHARDGVMPYVLFLEIEPGTGGLQRPPRKMELRFRDAQLVHGFVKQTVTTC